MCGLTREQRQALEELDACRVKFAGGEMKERYERLMAILRGKTDAPRTPEPFVMGKDARGRSVSAR